MVLLLETVTFSAIGAGVAPAPVVPKLSEGRSSESDNADATSTSTCTAPPGPGAGAPLHACAGETAFRGSGAAAVKSAALSPVSLQPSLARRAARMFDGAGAEPVPSKSLALP